MSEKDPADKPKKKENVDPFASFASGLLDVEKEDKEAKKEILREGIEDLENSEKKNILSSRMLTSHLSDAREKAGLSTFVGTSGKIKSPKFRRKEFLGLLARELLYIGTEEFKDKGGIVSLQKLEEFFAENRDNWELRDDDIKKAVQVLEKEKLIPQFEKLDDELQLIHFRPVELSKDTQALLKMAHGVDVTPAKLKDMLGWQEERVNAAITLLVNSGLAVVDGETIYFPGLW